MLRRKSVVLGILALSLALLVGALALLRHLAVRELLARERDLATRVAASRAGSLEATTLLRAGRYDMVAQVSKELVERVLQQFQGYRQLTRRGNRFLIHGLETRFEEGHAEVIARADFDWRWGLYDGPIEARYLVFAGVTADSECVLFFRVAEVKPLANWPFFNRLLAPMLTLRMQDSLAIRDVPLPIGLKTPPPPLRSGPPRARRPLGHSGVRITVPPRPWDLDGRRVLAMFDDQRLGLLVESRPGAPADEKVVELSAPPEGVDLAVRLPFLGELLSSAVRPADDIQIFIERLPRLWQNQGRLFGAAFDNHLDLSNVAGVIDIVSARTTLAERALQLRLELSGRFAGTATARLFGISFSLPFRVRPTERQELPLSLVSSDDGVGLAFGSGEIRVPLEVQTSVARMTMRGSYPLVIPQEIMDRALRLPGLRVIRVPFPTSVERGKVLASRPVALHVGWRLDLPARPDGFVRAHGDLHFEAGGPS